jgi:hypothetical protein
MEWKEALMAYLSNNHFAEPHFSISLALMPPELRETFIDFIKYIVESRKQLQKIKQELMN